MQLIIPNFWRQKTCLSRFLIPFAWLYNALVSLRKCNVKYRSKAKIISVGNITMGGAGKTPVVLSIAKIIKNQSKFKVAVLTRGYKGKLRGPLMVDANHNVFEVGDEALLLFTQVLTCVAKDRLKGIKYLEEQGYNVIITDDGLQDERFVKDLNILVVDSYFGFGNELVFPAGPLRESIELGVKKLHLVTLIGKGAFKYNFPKELPVLRGNLESKILLQQQKYIAFAGIGNPEKFFHSIIESEGEIVKKFVFGDHHQYTKKELRNLVALAQKDNLALITTEKDYMRIDAEFRNQVQVLPVSMVWTDEKMILQKLLGL